MKNKSPLPPLSDSEFAALIAKQDARDRALAFWVPAAMLALALAYIFSPILFLAAK